MRNFPYVSVEHLINTDTFELVYALKVHKQKRQTYWVCSENSFLFFDNLKVAKEQAKSLTNKLRENSLDKNT